MNPLIEQIYETGMVEDRQGEKYNAIPVAIKRQDGEALYRVVKDIGAKRTLETGMAYGLSSLFLMQGLVETGGSRHVSIDPYQHTWWHDVGLVNVERAGFGHLHRFFPAPSYETMPELIKAGERFDVVFIDGNHRLEYSLIDFILADRLLDTGGCLVLHDVWMGSIRKAVSFIVRNRGESYELAREYEVYGISAWRSFMRFLRAVCADHYDIFPAKYFSRIATRDYCVFRKTKHMDQEELDASWDKYSSF